MHDAQPPLTPHPVKQPLKVRRKSDVPFFIVMGALGGSYIVLVALLIAADAAYTRPHHFQEVLSKPEIHFALKLTLISCTISAILSLWVGVPLGYILSRYRFPGRWFVDSIVEIPVVLPPLVLGLSLLILFHLKIGGWQLNAWLEEEFHAGVTYTTAAVVLAQFSVAAAFAVRTMRVTFDQIDPRAEEVARTLGCTRGQAFLQIALPQATRGMLAAATIAWARSLGEFGPILVFAGATRMKTEVLSTTVFLELSIGNLEAAVAVSLIMVAIAFVVLLLLKWLGLEAQG